MIEADPLEGWLFQLRMRAEHRPSPYPHDKSREALDRLSQALADQPEGKVNYDKIKGGTISPYSRYWLNPDEAADAQALFLQVWEQGGAGSSYVLEGLLQSVALGLQPASLPFWQQVLDLSRPRDKSSTRRRVLALAALALMAISNDEFAAYAALLDALNHPHEQVRALAAYYLSQAYLRSGRLLPEPVEDALVDRATADRAFVARFQARVALRKLGRPAPHDDPDGAYIFKVQLRGVRATRTIAILPEHTLSDLHYAIQNAFDWDADHLYSFYLNGQRYDKFYEIGCPELDDNWSFAVRLITTDAEGIPTRQPPVDEEDEEGGELFTTNAEIGALGLVPKHKFMYFFDFGDSHEFTVTVLRVEPRSGDDYPRVIEAQGKAPRQYHSYEDEEDEQE